jgi:hypothetical protein
VLDLLRTYNFALQSVHMAARWLMLTRSYQIPIDELLQHNCFVKGVVERLEGAEYHISRRAVWPALMQEFVTISTLLYRFVRRGNLEQFAEQAVLVGAAAAETPNERKRSRDQLQPPSGVRAEFAVSGAQSSFRTVVAVTIGFDNLPGHWFGTRTGTRWQTRVTDSLESQRVRPSRDATHRETGPIDQLAQHDSLLSILL